MAEHDTSADPDVSTVDLRVRSGGDDCLAQLSVRELLARLAASEEAAWTREADGCVSPDGPVEALREQERVTAELRRRRDPCRAAAHHGTP